MIFSETPTTDGAILKVAVFSVFDRNCISVSLFLSRCLYPFVVFDHSSISIAGNDCPSSLSCDTSCLVSPIGAECYCAPGFALKPDNRTCEGKEDVNTSHLC